MKFVKYQFARSWRVAMSVMLKLSGAAIAFSWQILVLRVLGATDGGVVSIAQSQMRVIGTLGTAGRDRSLSLLLPQIKGGQTARRRIAQSQWATIRTTFALTIAAAVALMHWGGAKNSALYIILIAAGALTFALLVGAAGAARGLGLAIAGDIGFTLLPLAIGALIFVMLGLAWRWSISISLAALVAGQLVALLYLYFSINRLFHKRRIESAESNQIDIRANSDQLAMAIATTLSGMYPDVLLIFVGYLSSSPAAAAFGVAVRYIRLARFVPVSFLHVREPALASAWHLGQHDDLRNEARRIAIVSFFVSFAVLLPLFALPHFFLGLFGKSFVYYSEVMKLVIVAEMINSLFLMPSSILLVARRTRLLAILNVVSYGLGLLISWLVIGSLGVIGAAIVLVGTNLILGIGTSIAANLTTGIRADAFSAICGTVIRKRFHYRARKQVKKDGGHHV